MTIIKNGCICGGDYYTTTEQCDSVDCKSERKTTMKNKQNEANDYKCVLCETGEGERHGLECSENENNQHLTEEEKRLLRILVEKEIESFSNENCFLSIEYQNILQKL